MAANQETYALAFPGVRPKPHFSYGLAFPAACARHAESTFKASKIYIIVSNSISKTADFKNLQDALGDRVVGFRRGIKPHTPWDDILEIVADMRKREADLIITLGAGSLTDGAKVISLALANDVSTIGGLAALSMDNKKPSEDIKPCKIPIINIPTSLSGGEYSALAGATDMRDHQKHMFSHPSMGANLVILDPVLSVSTPAQIWLSTGVRAIDHCVEAICSLSPKVTAESDAHAVEGLRMLVPSLLLTKEKWEDEAPRLREMLGVVEAMKAIGTGIPLGGSHGIGHQLGPLGVGHGETSCILLPAVLKWTAKNAHDQAVILEKQEKVIDAFWGQEMVRQVLEERGLKRSGVDAGDVVDVEVRALGMPRTLKEVGVGRDKLNDLAMNSLKDPWLETNPVPIVTEAQVLEILEMVVGDDEKSNLRGSVAGRGEKL